MKNELPEKWRTVLVNGPYAQLDKFDIYAYYSHPKIQKTLLDDIKDNPVIVRQVFDKDRTILRRNDPKGKKLKIKYSSTDPRGITDTNNLIYWTHRRAVEFHKTLGTNTKEYIIDIDPGTQYDFKQTKKITSLINEIIKGLPEVKSTEIRYSGGRGFYVIGKLNKEKDVNEARKRLESKIRELINKAPQYKMVFNKPPGPHEVRIDLSPMKREGSIRAKYSINMNTGLASVPVGEDELPTFDKKSALPMKIIDYEIPEVKILKD